MAYWVSDQLNELKLLVHIVGRGTQALLQLRRNGRQHRVAVHHRANAPAAVGVVAHHPRGGAVAHPARKAVSPVGRPAHRNIDSRCHLPLEGVQAAVRLIAVVVRFSRQKSKKAAIGQMESPSEPRLLLF
jgi:hypothetical protein